MFLGDGSYYISVAIAQRKIWDVCKICLGYAKLFFGCPASNYACMEGSQKQNLKISCSGNGWTGTEKKFNDGVPFRYIRLRLSKGKEKEGKDKNKKIGGERRKE